MHAVGIIAEYNPFHNGACVPSFLREAAFRLYACDRSHERQLRAAWGYGRVR